MQATNEGVVDVSRDGIATATISGISIKPGEASITVSRCRMKGCRWPFVIHSLASMKCEVVGAARSGLFRVGYRDPRLLAFL
jgi:hypothetical protein